MKYITRLHPSAVLFDWDNTLVHQPDTKFLRLFNQALAYFDYAPGKMEDLVQANSSYDSFASRINCPKQALAAHMYFQELFAKEKISAENLMPGAKKLLEALYNNKIPMGIVSNLDHNLLIEQINTLELAAYFKVISGAEKDIPIKPDSFPLINAIKNIGLTPNKNILYVGDTPETDILCANKIGCYSILVGKRWNNTIKPDLKLNNLTELIRILPNKYLINNEVLRVY